MSSMPDRLLVVSVLGSVDWIAYLALRSTGPVVCAATVSALTALVLGLSRLLGSGPHEGPPK